MKNRISTNSTGDTSFIFFQEIGVHWIDWCPKKNEALWLGLLKDCAARSCITMCHGHACYSGPQVLNCDMSLYDMSISWQQRLLYCRKESHNKSLQGKVSHSRAEEVRPLKKKGRLHMFTQQTLIWHWNVLEHVIELTYWNTSFLLKSLVQWTIGYIMRWFGIHCL